MVFHQINTRLIINIPNVIISNISSFFHLALVYIEGFEQATMQAKANISKRAIEREPLFETIHATGKLEALSMFMYNVDPGALSLKEGHCSNIGAIISDAVDEIKYLIDIGQAQFRELMDRESSLRGDVAKLAEETSFTPFRKELLNLIEKTN